MDLTVTQRPEWVPAALDSQQTETTALKKCKKVQLFFFFFSRVNRSRWKSGKWQSQLKSTRTLCSRVKSGQRVSFKRWRYGDGQQAQTQSDFSILLKKLLFIKLVFLLLPLRTHHYLFPDRSLQMSPTEKDTSIWPLPQSFRAKAHRFARKTIAFCTKYE